MNETKPLMAQYLAFKNEYKDAILLFQIGDFFECFYEDAQKVSDALNIVLTSKSREDDAPPMAGFPQKALDEYLPKLVSAGFKVVVARQVENPKNAKGLVKRAVTEIFTPGTIATQEELLSRDKNYLACIATDGKRFGLAFADISTGEFKVYEDVFNDKNVTELLNRISPRELLKSVKDTFTNTEEVSTVVQPIEQHEFSPDKTKNTLLSHFGIPNLDPVGLSDFPLATTAAGVLLQYLVDTKKAEPKHITHIDFFNPRQALHIDPTTQRNLELFYNLKTHKLEGSLLGVIDQTKTAMGHRLLYEWLSFPETNPKELEKRYDVVDYFLQHSDTYQTIFELLTRFPDLQRLASALGLGRIHPKHVLVMAEAVEKAKAIHKEVLPLKDSGISVLSDEEISKLDEFVALVKKAITNNADQPTFLAEGYNEELDRLVQLSTNGEQFIKQVFEKEKANNMPSLRLTFNKVFGYSFELSRAKGDSVPEHFIKKQTLVNTERYITEELKQLESQVLSARDQLAILEGELYTKLLSQLEEYIGPLVKLGTMLAQVDTLLSFATSALTRRYVRPTLTTTERTLELEGMRHPVVEATVREFVPNDLTVAQDQNFLILTGPNMGGKSTFVRQIALIQIMAQIGSFIPASKATIPVVDKVFARIGASDDISTGKSTFMVELSEVAYIVSQATPQSLVILDEVGRGTSTYEGISIAWGIAQYIANHIGCTTIFTTHFRELTDLEELSTKFINYKVNLKEEQDTIYFLHTVTRGRSDKSYGIHVAKLVNLPDEIISTAFEVLNSFESKALPVSLAPSSTEPQKSTHDKKNDSQLDFFALASSTGDTERLKKLEQIEELLKDVDTDRMTPIEALILLKKITTVDK